MLVTMPLALAEGIKNAPKLHGEEVPDHGTVTYWQTGGKVAAKVGGDFVVYRGPTSGAADLAMI